VSVTALEKIAPDGAVTPTGTGAAVVSVRGLSKQFGAGPMVMSGLDLDIQHGSKVAIIGANGTGKSTLIRMLVRLVEPGDGDIRLLGEDVRRLGAPGLKRLRSRVGFVFQRHNLVTRLSALTNVVHGVQSRMSGPRSWTQLLAPREVRAEAMHCLERVGLADKAMARVDTLSGGQSQRVEVARMLMQRPELVIADEPDASLDPKSGEEVMATLAALASEQNATLIFVSHRMEHAIRFSERIVGLGGGRVALDQPSHMVSEAELMRFFHHD
jgi:phosphonate transport system ATP-binding protein